eukprot:jgi/Botrbrau1/14558/Bobra.27_3s0001.1
MRSEERETAAARLLSRKIIKIVCSAIFTLRWAFVIPYSLSLGVCCSLGDAYLKGERPLNGPWKLDEVLALAIAALSFILRFWAQESLKQFFTYAVGIREGHKLIRSGPYAVLRHPSYTGSILLTAGLLYFAGLRSLVMFTLYVVIITTGLGMRVIDEERVLLEAFGKEEETKQFCAGGVSNVTSTAGALPALLVGCSDIWRWLLQATKYTSPRRYCYEHVK